MSSSGCHAAENEDSGEATSISDAFADMLTVNEDLILATAESQAERNIDGLIAYQRVLHRDLMEMAEFIDSMFGVYSHCTINNSNPDSFPSLSTKSSNELCPKVVEAAAIEAEKKIRDTHRSKEQWIKARHRVLKEESVNAIMNQNINDMLGEMASTKAGKKQTQQGSAGNALANQLRVHQHIGACLEASKKQRSATGSIPLTATSAITLSPHLNLMLPSQSILPAATPSLAIFAPIAHVPEQQYIKPATVDNSAPKIALPPAHSMLNMIFAYPGGAPLIFNPQVVEGFIPPPHWQPQFQTPLPARRVNPAHPPAEIPKFKRMCDLCRKRHLSLRQCRRVLQHTDPEWQSAQPQPAVRRRRRKHSASVAT